MKFISFMLEISEERRKIQVIASIECTPTGKGRPIELKGTSYSEYQQNVEAKHSTHMGARRH